MSKWDQRFIQMADLVAQWSKDPSTKVGAIIVGEDNVVLATGFNGFPRGVVEEEEGRWERPAKYEWIEHAERNAIYNAARYGVRLSGSTLYLNFTPDCCPDCTRAIIQAGMVRVVGSTTPFPGQGKGIYYDKCGAAEVMMKEAGVTVEQVDANLS